MSLDLEQRLKVFSASAPARIRSIQVIEISHSAMTKAYRLWHEPYTGQVTTPENGLVTVEPLNMQIVLSGDEANLDQQFDINIDTTDIDDVFRNELELIPVTTAERIVVIYREYLSDDLTAVMTKAVLEVEAIAFKKGAATITATSPRYNTMRTGELYEPRIVPMLRAFY